MKADGITLSTVGAGGGANPFLEQLAKQGGGRFYAGDQPGQHPGHLPQGDPAGLRPADRRGAVLPDPDLVVADPARASTPACRSSSATTARPPSRPPRPCWSRRATIRSSPSGSTGSGGRWRGRRTRPGAGRRTGSAGTASRPVLQPARQLDVPGRGDRRHRGDLRDDRRHDRRSTSRASSADGSPRDFYSTSVAHRRAGPRAARPSNLAQVAPGRLRGTARRDRRRARTRSG